MMDIIRVKIKKSLPKLTGSLKKRMPIRTVPTAPIPVQTAYAVPIGSVFRTFVTMYKLSAIALAVPMHHKPFSRPTVLLTLFKQKVKTSSMHPDTTKRNQFIIFIFSGMRISVFGGCFFFTCFKK